MVIPACNPRETIEIVGMAQYEGSCERHVKNWPNIDMDSASGGLLNGKPTICESTFCYQISNREWKFFAVMKMQRWGSHSSIVINDNCLWITGRVFNF